MTIDEIRKSEKDVLTPSDIAPILGCDPCILREKMRKNVHDFEYPVSVIMSRVKIPRKAFLSWIEKNNIEEKKRCCVCGAYENRLTAIYSFKDDYYCAKHYKQISKNETITDASCFSRKDTNIYELYNDYAKVNVYSNSGLNEGFFIIDKDDVEKCKKYKWYIMQQKNNYYSARTDTDNKKLVLHKFLLDYYGDLQIDHINRNPLDNRKCNLRIVNSVENNANKTARNIETYKNGKYKCSFIRYGIRFYLGYFNTEEDAQAAKEKKLNEIEINKDLYLKQYEDISKEKSTGVSHLPNGKWRADCFIKGKMKRIGTFNTASEAKKAREDYLKTVEQ